MFAPYFFARTQGQTALASINPEIWKKQFSFVAMTRQNISDLKTLDIC